MKQNKKYIEIMKQLNYKPVGSVLLRLYGVMCCYLLGHSYKLKRNITPYIREIECKRCKKQFGMNDQLKSLLPMDDKLLQAHEILKDNYI